MFIIIHSTLTRKLLFQPIVTSSASWMTRRMPPVMLLPTAT